MEPNNNKIWKLHSSFCHLYKLYLDQGNITDDQLESFGFSKDVEIMGNKTRWDATITQENRQRAKCLSHIHQIELRQERIYCANVEATKEKMKDQANLIDKVESNKKVEEIF